MFPTLFLAMYYDSLHTRKIRRIVDGIMEVVDQVSMQEELGGHGRRIYSCNGVESTRVAASRLAWALPNGGPGAARELAIEQPATWPHKHKPSWAGARRRAAWQATLKRGRAARWGAPTGCTGERTKTIGDVVKCTDVRVDAAAKCGVCVSI
jgi:hypothetical protein